MKKFNIKLIGGTRITKWASTLKEALNDAESDYPNQIAGVEDASPFNNVNIEERKEPDENRG